MRPFPSDHPSITVDMTTDSVGRRVLHIAGEVDPSTCVAFKKALDSGILDYKDELIVDLQYVDFIDSSGLHALIEAARTISSCGGSISLRNPAPAVHRILEISGLLNYFRIAE